MQPKPAAGISERLAQPAGLTKANAANLLLNWPREQLLDLLCESGRDAPSPGLDI